MIKFVYLLVVAKQVNIPAGKIICSTEGANGSYGHHIPKIFISEEFSSKIIANFIKGQKKLIKLKTSDSKYKNIDERAFIVLDDCLYDTSWPKDKGIRALFMNGRHYKIFFLITMQFALGIPPVLRTNIDYVFLLRDSYKSNRKKYYEHYAGMFETFEQFCQVMDACTENYECLVIHNNSKSNKIEDMVFYYKAEDHGDFKMMIPDGISERIRAPCSAFSDNGISSIYSALPVSCLKEESW